MLAVYLPSLQKAHIMLVRRVVSTNKLFAVGNFLARRLFDLNNALEYRMQRRDMGNYLESNISGTNNQLLVNAELHDDQRRVNVIGLQMLFYLGVTFPCVSISTLIF
jgi:hypothetical protein